MASMLVCLCSCQWRTFLNIACDYQFVFSVGLHLMNFMLHIMLDTENHRLRVHYKCEMWFFDFYKRSISTLFRWGGYIFHECVKCFFLLVTCTNYTDRACFSRVMMSNVLPPFSVHNVDLVSIMISYSFQWHLKTHLFHAAFNTLVANSSTSSSLCG